MADWFGQLAGSRGAVALNCWFSGDDTTCIDIYCRGGGNLVTGIVLWFVLLHLLTK